MSDRTEDPTPRRLEKAREKGDVPVSHVAATALGFVAAVALAPAAVRATAARTRALLGRTIGSMADGGPAWSAPSLARDVVELSAPLLLGVAFVAAAAGWAQAGGLVAFGRTAPDLARLSPAQGLKSLFDMQRIWNVARALVAAAAVGWLVVRELRDHAGDLARATGRPDAAGLAAGDLVGRVALVAALIGLAIGAADVLVVRRVRLGRLRMTRAEVKREHRETEGDPQIKAARERSHREMLAAATIQAVRDATVLVINPEHLATALRYAEGEDEAPVVVASGEGDLARRMMDAARAWGVPVVRDVPVARALRDLEVGDAIPEALYEAVAEVLREAWEAEEPGDGTRGG